MKYFMALALLSLSVTAISAAEHNGTIKGFYISDEGRILIKFSNPIHECGDTQWPLQFYVSDPPAREWVSMILTARASEEEIRVGYRANPEGRCTIRYFYFY